MFSSVRAQPLWVATVAPVCALLKEVAGDAAEVRCVLPPGASPHDHQLTPQEARTLHQADWVVAVAPELEHFVQAWHLSHPEQQVLFLSHSDTIKKLPLRTACQHTHHHDHHDHHHNHDTPLWDPHLWLSPEQASQIVTLLAQTLPEIRPERVASLQERLQRLTTDLQQRLAPYQNAHYVVFHDAYQYFEHTMGLTGGHVLREVPEGPWTVREMREAQQWLHHPEVRAVFVEPQFDTHMLRHMDNPRHIPIVVVDPLGTENSRYEAFVVEVAERFLEGLKQTPAPTKEAS